VLSDFGEHEYQVTGGSVLGPILWTVMNDGYYTDRPAGGRTENWEHRKQDTAQ